MKFSVGDIIEMRERLYYWLLEITKVDEVFQCYTIHHVVNTFVVTFIGSSNRIDSVQLESRGTKLWSNSNQVI